MWIMGDNGVRHHSNTRVETGQSSLLLWMSRNEIQATLFSPSMFHVSMSGDHGVCIVVHVGKVGDDKEIG